MKTYAFIQSGEVAEIILPAVGPDGKDIGINDRFAPAFVEVMVDITELTPQPGLHWKFSGGEFTLPPELDEITPQGV